MTNPNRQKNSSLLIPSLTVGCCLLMVIIISVHFVWQVRYQALLEELDQKRQIITQLEGHLSKTQKSYSANSSTKNSKEILSHCKQSDFVHETAKPAAKSEFFYKDQVEQEGQDHSATHLQIFHEMFEDEFEHLSAEEISTQGKQILSDAATGMYSDDPEYQLDAAIALIDIYSSPLAKDVANNILQLAAVTEDGALREEMLRTLLGSVTASQLAEIAQHLSDEHLGVRKVSLFLSTQALLKEGFKARASAQEGYSELLKYIERNPEQVLESLSSVKLEDT